MLISLFLGDIMVILRTLRSIMSSGSWNSSTMHKGIAPPHGLQLSILRSMMIVSMLGSSANISAADAPEGPPPITATRYLRSGTTPGVADALTTLLADALTSGQRLHMP